MIFEVLVALGEALVNVAEHAVGEGLVERVGIERLQIALEREAEGRGPSRRRERCQRDRGSKKMRS